MLIALDANEANVSQRVGINQYAYQLLINLYQIDRKNRYLIFLKDQPLPDLPPKSSRWQYRVLKPTRLWTQLRLPIALLYLRKKPNVFFTLGHYRPRFSSIPTVIAIMDLSYFHFPQMFKHSDLIKLKNWTAYSVKKATHILTISEFSKKEIHQYYQVKPEKITVTYPGVDRKYFHYPIKKAVINQLLEKYQLPSDYLLFLGTLQPRKNLTRLFRAYAAISPPAPLVITGKKGWLYQQIFSQIKKLKLGKKVIFTDYVGQKDLPALMAQAICLCCPGLYEGFGLPALESLAVGTPVIAANNTSLPEVLGQAGILFNPYHQNEIQTALNKIIRLYFHNKVKYNQLVSQGLKQAQKFNWRQTAQKTLEVLHDVAV